jgi:peptide/nickel transport system substrate-binding protein
MRPLSLATAFGALTLAALSGCADRRADCTECRTLVVAAVGEPTTLVPPLVTETVGRDISDLVFERLADLAPGGAPVDSAAYRPRLADRWERIDSVTWRFHLRPGARWHDGVPVTAHDVAFSFQAFTDSVVDAGARSYLAGKVRATADDSAWIRIQFAAPSPEQLYDATYHVRIMPRHIWQAIPPAQWSADTAVAHLIGSGPYRIVRWTRGQSLELATDTTRHGTPIPALHRVLWRFADDPDAALNLLLAHEADVLETVGAADRAQRVAHDTAFRLVTYPSAVYGFLGFRLADHAGRPHPMLRDCELRRALVAAVNRDALARVVGPDTRVPPGPMSRGLWIWDDGIRTIPFDSVGARHALDQARARGQLRPIDILVPASSQMRRQLAQAVQEAWRRIGVAATVTVVDFPVFQERLNAGRFDSYIGVYLDEPSPRGLADQWTRAGWEALNYSRYANPHFDTLLAAASRETDPAAARRRWHDAMDTLNADAPAIFLYTLTNTAAVRRRLTGVTIDPYAWVSTLPAWGVGANQSEGRH